MDLKLFRQKELKLTQTQLAIKLGISPSYLGRMEEGTKPLSDKVLDKIHEVFKVDVEEFKSYNIKTTKTQTKEPGQIPVSEKWICDNHRKVLNKLQIRGRYAFYSWKHTGVVKCVQAGMNIRDIQNQLRHHSLEMVMEYLKGLGVMQSHDLKHNFPNI